MEYVIEENFAQPTTITIHRENNNNNDHYKCNENSNNCTAEVEAIDLETLVIEEEISEKINTTINYDNSHEDLNLEYIMVEVPDIMTPINEIYEEMNKHNKIDNNFEYMLESEENIMHNEHNKEFNRESSINTQNIHIEVEIFKCSICSEILSHKSKLDIHFKIHTIEKPFKCAICNKKFVHQSKLDTHFKIHTGEKPFKCVICNKKFVQKSNLKSHMLTHTGVKKFKCPDCSTRFSRNWNLRKHKEMIHFKEKHPFKCNVCHREFKNNFNLETHMLIHSGATAFKCNMCDKSYTRMWNLNKHKAKIHQKQNLSNV